MKILLVVGMSAWIVGVASLLAVAGIETAALRQPHTAVGQYRHPNDIKGRVRFFTDTQEQVHSVASPLIFVSLIIFVAASVFYNGIQKRWTRIGRIIRLTGTLQNVTTAAASGRVKTAFGRFDQTGQPENNDIPPRGDLFKPVNSAYATLCMPQ
jgi:hypothetical protein